MVKMCFILKSSREYEKSVTQFVAHFVEPAGIPFRSEPWRIGIITVLIEIMEHDSAARGSL